LNADCLGPVELTVGMSVSFVTFGVLVTAFGSSIGSTPDRLAQIDVLLMIVFGVILFVLMFSR
tara:strand:+ start:526 stop:714 length:189 start_codon:yes stop_codon:yes gene_type:complete